MKIPPAYLLVIIAAIIWGATPAIMKLTLTQIPIFTLAFIRMFIASLIMFLLFRNKLKIQKKDIYTFINLSLTGVTLNISLFFIGLKLTQAINAAFLIAAAPLLTVVAAHLFLKEKLEFRLILAGLVAIFGLGIIVGQPAGLLNTKEITGNFLLLLSSLAWVAHEIIAKKLLKTYNSNVVTFYAMFIGAMTFLPLYLMEFFTSPNWLLSVNTTGFLGLLYGIFFASLIAYWTWQKGLKSLPAGEASFFFYLDPISGALFSIILLGEKITPNLVFGGILILTAVILAEYRRKRHPLINHNH